MATSPASLPASLAIVNARVWTNDPRRPWVDALLVRDGLVEAVGSSAEVKKRAGAGTRVVDAEGHTVTASAGATVLRVGTEANVVLLDRDLPRVTPEALGAARVVLAIVAGHLEEADA